MTGHLTITVDDFLDLDPCYAEERIRGIAGEKEMWSALEVLDLDIPAEDRIWVVLRKELIAESHMHEIACRFAESVSSLWTSPASKAAIAAKRSWLSGDLDDDGLAAAEAAAWAAAWAAAEAAARAAAGDAQIDIIKNYLKEVAGEMPGEAKR